MDADGFTEVQSTKAVKTTVPSINVQDVPSPSEDPRYKAVTNQLETMHADLVKLEKNGKLAVTSDQPGVASEYQQRMRLNVNRLYGFLNTYIDVLSDLEKEYAEKRQALFVQSLTKPKGTPSSAEKYANEMTRVDQMTIKLVQNRIQQIKNDYERYNGICISLQSKMKAENTERIMG